MTVRGEREPTTTPVHDGEWPTLEFSRQVVEEDKRKRLQLGLPGAEGILRSKLLLHKN